MGLFVLQFVVLLAALFLGVRLGGMGIGFAGGLGVVVLTLGLGMDAGAIPWDVILIIMSVIGAISCMQLAGGLDYLVLVAEKILRANPKYINYLAPFVTYALTLLAGTGHTSFSVLPVIVEVAKGQKIRPCRPLSLAVVASQVAITASPVSAAVITMSAFVEPLGVSYPLLLSLIIPSSFLGCALTAFLVSAFFSSHLEGAVAMRSTENKELPKGARLSVWIFVAGIVAVVLYATAISKNVGWIAPVHLPRNGAIMAFMLTIAACIVFFCKIKCNNLVQTSTFKAGLSACVCVLGVAWLGDTFVKAYIEPIKTHAAAWITHYPFLLAVGLFFTSMLLYSQAATTKALIPSVILAMGLTPAHPHGVATIIASFAATSALFVLPTYPTLLGAVQMDDTGSTQIGKYVFNHPFLIPGTLAIAFSVGFGFLFTSLWL
ncbi:anaerobic C4-dicarboxylate transporter [Helicobacter sp. NHP22-001]|uniref:anaerobic C4-dicarboxylate transporter n=1 Tax=Helicobacter sp. NHP22-001 TaxID=3040202 RepID=UPI00244D8101|nr:anaerobic C4-dicarboxylate transporter [Helicobacter sp. NHP22-001]GMB96927.1 Anaerobic C4-dicarboxylate transporter [Helicobacter sp. NHP22-001]